METNTQTPAAPPVRSTDLVRIPFECERRYYSHYETSPEDHETGTFLRNMEATDGDHWRVELNLERWRSAKELADYLRWAAKSVEVLQARKPNDKLRHGAKTPMYES
jgi:hypothetical protein